MLYIVYSYDFGSGFKDYFKHLCFWGSYYASEWYYPLKIVEVCCLQVSHRMGCAVNVRPIRILKESNSTTYHKPYLYKWYLMIRYLEAYALWQMIDTISHLGDTNNQEALRLAVYPVESINTIKYRIVCGADTLKLAFELIRLVKTNLLYIRELYKAMIIHSL